MKEVAVSLDTEAPLFMKLGHKGKEERFKLCKSQGILTQKLWPYLDYIHHHCQSLEARVNGKQIKASIHPGKECVVAASHLYKQDTLHQGPRYISYTLHRTNATDEHLQMSAVYRHTCRAAWS